MLRVHGAILPPFDGLLLAIELAPFSSEGNIIPVANQTLVKWEEVNTGITIP